jgi:hypothetical protein
VRYGSDKLGNYTAILLIKADSLGKPARYREPVGVQRFYDRNIKGRKTNKDFTYGFTKKGACHLLGEIDKDYAGLLPICEGYADGVLAHTKAQVPVIVGLDADNVLVVAQAAAEQFPKATVMPICDNDAHKYKQGVDNGGVLKGVEAATKFGGKYVIPDFTGYDQSGKPKDLWDLWDLAGDEAVDKLLSNPQSPPENWDEFRLNYLGLESFWKEVDRVIRHNQNDPLKAAFPFAQPHLERLGLDSKAIEAHVSQAAQPAVLSIGGGYAQSAHISRLAKADETVCIERDYIGIDLLKHRTLLIEGGMGTGKTEWLKNELARLKPLGIKSVLCIYPRRSLAKNSSGRLSLEYYEDIEIISIEADFGSDLQLSAVSNSLKRLGLTGDWRFDVVVMDEIELNIQHIFGGTFDKKGDLRHDTLQILRGLVKNAKYFVGMQAQITQLSYDFLRFCGRVDDAHLIRNTYQRFNGHPVAWHGNKEDCIKYLKDCMDKGEPCIIACMSLKLLRELEDDLKARYPNEQIVAVHSDNKGDPSVKAILENPDVVRPLALLHTPVIDMGVSIESKWFKHGVGFCQTGKGVGTPDSFTQMMFRDRHLKDHAIFVEPQTYNKPTDYMDIIQGDLANVRAIERTLESLGNGKSKFSIVFDDSDVLRAQTQVSINASKNNATAEVHTILGGSMGCDIKFVKPDEADKAKRDEIKADLKAAKERVKENDMAAITAAPAITPKQCEDLCRSNENTSADMAKIKKHLMEKYLGVRLAFQNSSDLKEIFEFWDDGRGKGKLRLREIMALPQKQAVAYAEKLYVVGTPSLFLVTWLLLTWVLEVFGGRFDNDGRLEGGGKWVCYKDFQGHKTWEWIKDKNNRDAANRTGLIYIHGKEPDEREIGGLIKQSGLPVESKRVDENTDQPEVSNPDDGKVGQKSVPTPPSNTLLYKNKKGGSAQKNVLLSKQPREYLYSIDPSTRLTPPKATDSLGCLIFDWLVARLKDLVELKVLDGGRIECKSAFNLADLCQGNEYQKVLTNETAFNKAKLGAQIKDGVISPKGLGALLRRFGFNYSSKRVNKGSKAKPADDKNKRTQARLYRLVPSQEPEFLRENLARRAGDLYYAKAAQERLDQKAQEIAEFGAPLIPDRPVSPTTARYSIRYGILDSLHIRSDKRGGLTCDKDFAFRYEDLTSEPWYQWACEHKDLVNAAGLGAKFTGDAPSVQVITAWIKAMGIRTIVKLIDVHKFHKLLNYKEVENETQGNTGDVTVGSGTDDPACHPNKSVGVENNTCKNNCLKRERVRVHFIDPKCLPKVREIMDKDEHDREDELIAAIMEDAQKPQNILESKLMGHLDQHRGEYQYVTDLADMFGAKARDLDPIVAKIQEIECRMDEKGKARIRLPDPFEGAIENPDSDPWSLDDEVPY